MIRRGLKRLLRRTVIVHTKDDRSFRGVLLHQHADCIVLAHVRLLDADLSLGGETVILRENVGWIQDVTGMERTAPVEGAFVLEPGERP